MAQRSIRCIVTFFALVLVSTTIGFSESSTRVEPIGIHGRNSSWQVAQVAAASMHRFIVVTVDQLSQRQACRVQSFTAEKLVCARVIGGPRTYLPNQVPALIVPGDNAWRLRVLLGLNAGLARQSGAQSCLRRLRRGYGHRSFPSLRCCRRYLYRR